MESPLTITFRVVQSLKERGYCILGANELEQLFAQADNDTEKARLLHEFAVANDARVEVGPRLRSAKLTATKSSYGFSQPGARELQTQEQAQ